MTAFGHEMAGLVRGGRGDCSMKRWFILPILPATARTSARGGRRQHGRPRSPSSRPGLRRKPPSPRGGSRNGKASSSRCSSRQARRRLVPAAALASPEAQRHCAGDVLQRADRIAALHRGGRRADQEFLDIGVDGREVFVGAGFELVCDDELHDLSPSVEPRRSRPSCSP